MSHPHTPSLQQQTVAILGGGSGIGRAVAQAAHAAGARVFVLGRSAAADEGIAAIQVDITDADALRQAFASIGHIDHLVSTVGARVPSAKLPDLRYDDLALTFKVKLFGNLIAIQQALPFLAPQASITLTSGLLSRKYGAGSLLKGAVNAAVEAAGKQLAKELAPRRVNVVSPGVVDTGLWGEAGSEGRLATMARVGGGLPVGRVGRPEELAAAYLFAMQNGFVTGTVIDADGGGLL